MMDQTLPLLCSAFIAASKGRLRPSPLARIFSWCFQAILALKKPDFKPTTKQSRAFTLVRLIKLNKNGAIEHQPDGQMRGVYNRRWRGYLQSGISEFVWSESHLYVETYRQCWEVNKTESSIYRYSSFYLICNFSSKTKISKKANTAPTTRWQLPLSRTKAPKMVLKQRILGIFAEKTTAMLRSTRKAMTFS
jgi:hypothetical protein